MVEGKGKRNLFSVSHRRSDVKASRLLYLAPISSLNFSVSDFFPPAGLVPLVLLAIFSARLRASYSKLSSLPV